MIIIKNYITTYNTPHKYKITIKNCHEWNKVAFMK